eukprot:scaffold52998_cov51-Phaeocystis_antarctica.AAC.3
MDRWIDRYTALSYIVKGLPPEAVYAGRTVVPHPSRKPAEGGDRGRTVRGLNGVRGGQGSCRRHRRHLRRRRR